VYPRWGLLLWCGCSLTLLDVRTIRTTLQTHTTRVEDGPTCVSLKIHNRLWRPRGLVRMAATAMATMLTASKVVRAAQNVICVWAVCEPRVRVARSGIPGRPCNGSSARQRTGYVSGSAVSVVVLRPLSRPSCLPPGRCLCAGGRAAVEVQARPPARSSFE
jgi:hypothetical protein